MFYSSLCIVNRLSFILWFSFPLSAYSPLLAHQRESVEFNWALLRLMISLARSVLYFFYLFGKTKWFVVVAETILISTSKFWGLLLGMASRTPSIGRGAGKIKAYVLSEWIWHIPWNTSFPRNFRFCKILISGCLAENYCKVITVNFDMF